MPFRRRGRHRMTYTDQRTVAYGDFVQDQPISMMDYENSYLTEGIRSKHDRTELFDANRYRRRRPITKIFRDSKYVPGLDDIEELDESTSESDIYVVLVNDSSLSLNSLHKERMRNHKGRVKRPSLRRRLGVNTKLNTLSEAPI